MSRFSPVRSWRRTLHNGADRLQLFGVGLLEIDRVQCHHQVGRVDRRHRPPSDSHQAPQELAVAEAPVGEEAIDPLRQRPGVLLLPLYPARHRRHHRRLTAHDPLHRLHQHPPQALVRQLRRHRREERLQRVLQLGHRERRVNSNENATEGVVNGTVPSKENVTRASLSFLLRRLVATPCSDGAAHRPVSPALAGDVHVFGCRPWVRTLPWRRQSPELRDRLVDLAP